MLSKWKQRYLAKGAKGLKPAYKRIDTEVRALEEENEKLKRIITRQAFEIVVKSELLKNTLYQTQEKVMLTKQFADRAPVQLLSSGSKLPRSTFYCKAHPGQRSMKLSTHMLYNESLIASEEVVGKIKELISGHH